MTLDTYFHNLCKHMGINDDAVQVTVQEDDQTVQIQLTVPAEESGLFIGFHGETLASLQRMARVIFQEQFGEKKVLLNVNDYRQQRQDKLEEMARNIAHRVLETGRQYRFGFLPPQERFIIHSTISNSPEFSELESVSEGEGNQRFLTIRLKATE